MKLEEFKNIPIIDFEKIKLSKMPLGFLFRVKEGIFDILDKKMGICFEIVDHNWDDPENKFIMPNDENVKLVMKMIDIIE